MGHYRLLNYFTKLNFKPTAKRIYMYNASLKKRKVVKKKLYSFFLDNLWNVIFPYTCQLNNHFCFKVPQNKGKQSPNTP